MIKRETNEPEKSFDIDLKKIEDILDKDYTEVGSTKKALELLKRKLKEENFGNDI